MAATVAAPLSGCDGDGNVRGMAMQADWRGILKRLSEASWNEHGLALVLSRVPALLAAEGVDPSELLQGRRLRPFLESEGAGYFELIQNENNPIVWGVIPAGAGASPPYSRYFAAPKGGDRPIRFAPSAWKAFTLPIPPGQRRWLTDEPSVHFFDVDAEEAPAGGYEVERRFIVDAEASGEVDQALVVARIAEWAAERKVDPSRLALGRKRPPTARIDRPSEGGASALDQLLQLLSPSELSRISMPLDVIVRLRSTKASGQG